MASNKQDALGHLQRVFAALHPLPEAEWRHFTERAAVQTFARGETLLRAGESADVVFFLHKGLTRTYSTLEDGTLMTREFCAEGQFACPLISCLRAEPAAVAIDALDEAQIVRFRYSELKGGGARHPGWLELTLKLVENCFVGRERRGFEFQSVDAGKRYEHFCQTHPQLAARLNQKQVAEYLGISPVSLSRIIRARRD